MVFVNHVNPLPNRVLNVTLNNVVLRWNRDLTWRGRGHSDHEITV